MARKKTNIGSSTKAGQEDARTDENEDGSKEEVYELIFFRTPLPVLTCFLEVTKEPLEPLEANLPPGSKRPT